MTIAEPRLRHEPAPQVVTTRMQRRTLLDMSIDEEIVRGDLRGARLEEPLLTALTLVVEHELKQEEALSEADIIEMLRPRRFLGSRRTRQRLDTLADMNLLRREGQAVRATVAGIAAVLRPSSLDGRRLPRDLLRVLRQAELAQRY